MAAEIGEHEVVGDLLGLGGGAAGAADDGGDLRAKRRGLEGVRHLKKLLDLYCSLSSWGEGWGEGEQRRN
jgi:hypothetical protein